MLSVEVRFWIPVFTLYVFHFNEDEIAKHNENLLQG